MSVPETADRFADRPPPIRAFEDLKARLSAALDRYILPITIAALLAGFFLLAFADRMIVTIPAGHAAVKWKRFAGGTVLSRTYAEGLHVMWPWDYLTIYDLRFEIVTRDFHAIDREGLRFTLEFSTRIRPKIASLPRLHQSVGPNYVNVLVIPEISAHARRVISANRAEEVYSERRESIREEILNIARREVPLRRPADLDLIEIEDILIRDVTLPPVVAMAIEEKIRQKQLDQEWQYRIQREAKESERKVIEARGIQQFQDIVTRGISENYLRWKGIDATLKLAESNNAKIVIIGSSPSGLPIILGNEAVAQPAAAPAPRADVPAELQTARPPSDVSTPARAPSPAATPSLAAGSGEDKSAKAQPKPTEPNAAPPSNGPGWLGTIGRLLGWGQ